MHRSFDSSFCWQAIFKSYSPENSYVFDHIRLVLMLLESHCFIFAFLGQILHSFLWSKSRDVLLQFEAILVSFQGLIYDQSWLWW